MSRAPSRLRLPAVPLWASGLLEFVYPQRCPGCARSAPPSRLLCPSCECLLPPVATPLCARCLVADRDPVGCLRHPGFSVRAAWVYDERVACLVHALKYGGRVGLAVALSEALETALRGEPRPDLILAVPLHPARLRERGYNQAERLAAELSRRIGVPRLEGAMVRTRPTTPQARLGVVERRRNVADAFRVGSPEVLDGRNVLIVDDVMTTGATLEACLVTLAAVGARARAAVLAWAS